MARADALSRLIAKDKSALSFNFDMLTAPPMLSLLSPYDIKQLEDISKDPRLNAKIVQKREYINQILTARGFKRFASGTNRIVYKFLEDQSLLLKVAISDAGIQDSPKEFHNQYLLKPFVAKCFEVSPQGSVGLFERVDNITSIQQYYSIGEEIYNLLSRIIGKYVIADIGTKFFMNIGIRKGFGPVLLDYPLVYELDGGKLFCDNIDPMTGIPCGGEIDYDAGYNFLYCTKCHKQFFANQLAKGNLDGVIIKGRKEHSKMKIVIEKGDKVKVKDSIISTDTYVKNIRSRKEEKNNTVATGKLSVSVVKNNKKQKISEETNSEEEFNETLNLNEEVKTLEQERAESNEPEVEVASDDLEEKEIENDSEEVSENAEESDSEEDNDEESVDEDTETEEESECEEVETEEDEEEEEEEFVPRMEAPFPAVAPGQKKKANAQHKQKEKDDVEYKVVRRQKSEIPEDSKMENY